MCIGAVTLPIGIRYLSQTLPTVLAQSPTMSEPSSQPTVPEIVQCADELYDGNKMRDGLNYLLQYKDMEDIEVEVNVCIIDMQL